MGTGCLVPSQILQNSRSAEGQYLFAVLVWFAYQLSQYVYWQPFRTQFFGALFLDLDSHLSFLCRQYPSDLDRYQTDDRPVKENNSLLVFARGLSGLCGGSGSLRRDDALDQV